MSLEQTICLNKMREKNQMNTFDIIRNSIENVTHHTFNMKILQQILYVVPHFYILKYAEKKNKSTFNINDSFNKDYDLIIGPTATTTAYNQTDSLDDPLKSFLDDVLVNPANMAGLPGLNVPVGFDSCNMPIGMHIIGNDFDEAKMYQLASYIEKELNLNLTPGGEK
jgi:Asp-tRNA(Asn)/Glu-tRNA(Gln) amidotransferase A subunit family amidase